MTRSQELFEQTKTKIRIFQTMSVYPAFVITARGRLCSHGSYLLHKLTRTCHKTALFIMDKNKILHFTFLVRHCRCRPNTLKMCLDRDKEISLRPSRVIWTYTQSNAKLTANSRDRDVGAFARSRRTRRSVLPPIRRQFVLDWQAVWDIAVSQWGWHNASSSRYWHEGTSIKYCFLVNALSFF